MNVQLDHLILNVNDRDASVRFFVDVLGFKHDGEDGPFTVIRVNPTLTLQLAPWGTGGGTHLAFAMSKPEFDLIFQRIRDHSIQFGDKYDSVGTSRGPGDETGALGNGKAIYMFDPNKHLIEIRHYES